MKKFTYALLALFVACMALADDHIIQFVLNTTGKHVSFRTSEVVSITYDYHDQDSIDQAYRDSVRAAFVKDSLYQDSLYRDALMRDSIGRWHTVGYTIDSLPQYSIFTAALKLTGLYDSLNVYQVKEFTPPRDTRDRNWTELFYPVSSRNGFTLFAETDSVLRASGINSLDDLIGFSKAAYGQASQWYDYLREKGLAVSTGTDYTNKLNTLNMFMAYHILKSQMAADQLVYEHTENYATTWNYCNGAQPHDYFETMLPRTLMKVWLPDTAKNELFINRYVANNTLTDRAASMGSEAMHTLVSEGVKIVRPTEGGENPLTNVQAYNGYIHALQGILVYDKMVPQGVLHERMRFDFASMQPEMNNNGWRFMTYAEKGYRMAFPNDYFENIRVLRQDTRLRYNTKGSYNSYMSDAIIGWGQYDVAAKLPPLPAGTYEMRIPYVTMLYGGKVEYSIGPDPDDVDSIIPNTGEVVMRNFELIDTIDVSIYLDDPRIGLTDYLDEADLGLASDKKMRENGYMRGPFSYKDHPEFGEDGSIYNQRSSRRNPSIRRIMGRFEMKQSEDRWLRLRALTLDETDLNFILDYIEFVPVDVVDNKQYMEDWY